MSQIEREKARNRIFQRICDFFDEIGDSEGYRYFIQAINGTKGGGQVGFVKKVVLGEEAQNDGHHLTTNMELIETKPDGTKRFRTANGVYQVKETEHGKNMTLED